MEVGGKAQDREEYLLGDVIVVELVVAHCGVDVEGVVFAMLHE
jgi:uncharacterized protein YwlG (UPF0340 family)